MSGAISPLPQYVFMSWCLVKHMDNFTFYIIYIYVHNAFIIYKERITSIKTYIELSIPINILVSHIAVLYAGSILLHYS
jgi:hypothetical protein